MQRDRDMAAAKDDWEIDQNADVYSADDQKIGQVAEVHDTYLTVTKGFLFQTERYVPATAIRASEQGRVDLAVTKDQIDQMDWDRIPEPGMARRAVGESAAESEGAMQRPAAPPRPEGVARDAEGRQTLKLREEELRARKETVQAGEATLRKDVISEQKTIDVPVTHEEVVVERHAVDHGPAEGAIGEGETIRVPLTEERVTAEKVAVVTEEVSIGKRKVQETERFTDTVRHEEAKIEETGDLEEQQGDPTTIRSKR